MPQPDKGAPGSGGEQRTVAWFCVQTHPKHEHIAAAQLRQDVDIAVFLPRIRYQRPTRCGPAWVSEALFPNYLFARFDLADRWRRVQNARAVRGVVHFGNRWPAIPDSTIAELREAMGPEEMRVLGSSLRPGESVEISGRVFGGLQAVVSRVMSNSRRVAVLLDFLGRQTTVELAVDQVLPSEGFLRRRAVGYDNCLSTGGIFVGEQPDL